MNFLIKRSKVILGSSSEQTWQTLSPQCYIQRFSLKVFLVLEQFFSVFFFFFFFFFFFVVVVVVFLLFFFFCFFFVLFFFLFVFFSPY